ncbi:MAG: type II toxin-antitoxin system HicB family antitoxin [Alphaproteobacteria bacterium]|nr:type II toxin-antitoxin system HicB family antitoxin [Alphaproteobacteria bacterium]
MKVEYPFTIRPLTKGEGGGYLIEFPDLPGCISDGDTPEEAIRNGVDAVRSWIKTAKASGDPIPKPSVAPSRAYSGRWVTRAPRTLHRRLAERAAAEGVSLNQLTVALLSEGLGTRVPSDRSRRRSA